jgi:thioredoxin-related protein
MLLFIGATTDTMASAADKINWLRYTDAQQKEKNNDGKKLFFYFSSRSCGYCRMLENKTFKNEAVIDYLNTNFHPVWIITDDERKLAQRFSITGVPDLRFLTHEGKEIARWPGYIEAKDLINLLKFVHTDSYQKMNYIDFLKKQ